LDVPLDPRPRWIVDETIDEFAGRLIDCGLDGAIRDMFDPKRENRIPGFVLPRDFFQTPMVAEVVKFCDALWFPSL